MRGSTRRRTIRSATADLLGRLGTSTAEVAATLESAGVRGVPRSGTSCAVARYLHAVMAADPAVQSVVVSSEGVSISVRRWWLTDILVPVPGPVGQFIRQFDSGDFSTLVVEREGQRPRRTPGGS
jgi:hypothetical protein